MMSTRKDTPKKPVRTTDPLPLGGPFLWLYQELTRRRRLAAR